MLYSYKMTDDSGFAPNPFFGTLTLATCKPLIRKLKNIGDYIAGFTSTALCNDKVGEERLVYIMKVSGKLTYSEYFSDRKFECKKPTGANRITQSGDNIYCEIEGKYVQIQSYFHRDKESQAHDLTSNKILLSDNFFYFGTAAIPVDKFKINIPKTQTAHGVKTSDENEINRLWNYLNKNFKKNIPIGSPHNWKLNEPFITLPNGCR